MILVLIGFNYLLGFVALTRSRLIVLAAFGLVDFGLAVACLVSTHQGRHIGNLGALAVFAASSVLAGVVVYQTWRERIAQKAASVQNARVNCYHGNF